MAKFKKVVILVFAVLMLFGICALSAGCSYGDKFEELQQRIDKLEEEKNSLLGRVQDLEEENNNLSKEIHDLEIKLQVMGHIFYDLQEAYNKELFTHEDLLSIAYYHNGGIGGNESKMDKNFVPVPKIPESLSEKTKRAIKYTYLEKVTEKYPEATIDNIGVGAYYGTYNSCIVVEVSFSCIIGDILYYPEYVIGDVVFYNFTPVLCVWYTTLTK